MALLSIDSLIRQQIVENSRIDYKRNWNPEDIVHSICTFANDIDNCNAKLSDLKPSLIQEFLADVESDFYQNSLSHSVEEALCNAVYHKSYQIGEPVTVMITPEKEEEKLKSKNQRLMISN